MSIVKTVIGKNNQEINITDGDVNIAKQIIDSFKFSFMEMSISKTAQSVVFSEDNFYRKDAEEMINDDEKVSRFWDEYSWDENFHEIDVDSFTPMNNKALNNNEYYIIEFSEKMKDLFYELSEEILDEYNVNPEFDVDVKSIMNLIEFFKNEIIVTNDDPNQTMMEI